VSNFTFSKFSLRVSLSFRESRAIGRPGLSIEKSRLISVDLVDFPGSQKFGHKISKNLLFKGDTGEYRLGSKKLLVLGSQRGSEPALRISISHPNIDEIWVCGVKATSLQKDLESFMQDS